MPLAFFSCGSKSLSLYRVLIRDVDKNSRSRVMPLSGRLVPIREMYDCNLLVTRSANPVNVVSPL